MHRCLEEPAWEEITSLTTLEEITLKPSSNNCFYRKDVTQVHQLHLFMVVLLCQQFCYTAQIQGVLHCLRQVASSRTPKQCLISLRSSHSLVSVSKNEYYQTFLFIRYLKKYSVDRMLTVNISCYSKLIWKRCFTLEITKLILFSFNTGNILH